LEFSIPATLTVVGRTFRGFGTTVGVWTTEPALLPALVDLLERLADALPVERAASRWIVSSDPDEHIEKIKPYIDMGFRHLVFHAPGNDQARFLKIYGELVLPRLRRQFG